ncbi:unnamed protein product [Cylicocyclus nassatus]|uniref:Plasma membrane proteolipid 3 n=1 Tax=Cylicocyclus nassatus TaxID=53992 RepID=A0AA36GMQ3_CYLNA|nr:unnamed protein product [Cylicocyclus nassatus]
MAIEFTKDTIIEIVCILILPPVAVYWHTKQCGCPVCLNVVLCFLFWIPAMLHAAYVCFLQDQS